MRRKQEGHKKGSPAYMSTYGDMMTLLLTFFVLLFSMSTVDADKFQQLVSSMSTSVSIFQSGQTMKTDTNILQNGMKMQPMHQEIMDIRENNANKRQLQDMEEELNQYVKEQLVENKITITNEGNYLSIRFEEAILFDSGKAEIKAGAIPALGALGEKLKEYVSQGYILNIVGHTDNQPIHTKEFPNNWYLSSARAIAVMNFYLEHMDFDVSKVSCTGRADVQPIAPNDTAEGKAKNRRVEINISRS